MVVQYEGFDTKPLKLPLVVLISISCHLLLDSGKDVLKRFPGFLIRFYLK